jgi:hypothetical protein
VTRKAREILQRALELSEAERALLVEALAGTIGPGALDASFAAELVARARSVVEGGERGAPANEVMARLRAKHLAGGRATADDLAPIAAAVDRLTAASFPRSPAKLMEARDRPRFERDWLRVFDQLREVRERQGNHQRALGAALDGVAERGFERTLALTGDDDLAAQVSDDLLLIGDALLRGFEDPWLNALWLAYREARFPHAPLEPMPGTLGALLGSPRRAPKQKKRSGRGRR